MTANSGKGSLFLIPVDLGRANADLFAPYHLEVVRRLDHFVAERAKTARAFLKAIGHPKPMSEISISELDKHKPEQNTDDLLRPIFEGYDLGFMSEAGLPCIADPGYQLVQAAHRHRIEVKPLIGPSSLLLALMGSGMNGQSFAFNGYLPREKDALRSELITLQKRIRNGQTQLFIETPYRNQQLLEAMINVLPADIRLCIAKNLSLEDEWIFTTTLGQWKSAIPDLKDSLCVFVLGI